MHELGIAQDIKEIVLKKKEELNLKKISKITIKVGVASYIEKDFLIHSLKDHAFKNTILEKTEIVILDEKIRLKCKTCGYETEELEKSECPRCKNAEFDIVGGNTIYVESIEGE